MNTANIDNIQLWGETLRFAVELAGTAAFALSGVLVGAHKRLDAVGVCVVGFLAAFGGGTLRDLLLDERPFFGFATWTCCGACWPCACWPCCSCADTTLT